MVADLIADIREGLADNLSVIDGIQVSAYVLGNPTPPALYVEPGEIEYDRAMARGLDTVRLTIRAFVAHTTDVGAQRRLDRLLAAKGDSSVKQAAESDRTLGGKVDDLRVVRCSGYRIFAREGGPAVLGAEWDVEVFATGL